jgi:hypothetical protein
VQVHHFHSQIQNRSIASPLAFTNTELFYKNRISFTNPEQICTRFTSISESRTNLQKIQFHSQIQKRSAKNRLPFINAEQTCKIPLALTRPGQTCKNRIPFTNPE